MRLIQKDVRLKDDLKLLKNYKCKGTLNLLKTFPEIVYIVILGFFFTEFG